MDHSSADGIAPAPLLARHEGEAELRSTASFRGDPFGPQTLLWRLRVRVES
ncbi:hypothetical protein ACFXKR_33340 [Streptomyces violascens]|uniref:hypothetical protein n=1 Tax=Streptomyces violascens TaxID=67381 RepID=UPI00368ECDB8